MFFKSLTVIFGVSFLLQPVSYVGSYAEEGRWEEPWQIEASLRLAKQEDPDKTESPAQKVAEGFFWFFQKYISPVDGDRCPSYPTCSQYALEAVQKHGALLGLMMTFDRLIHESDEIRNAPLIKIHGVYRYYDPMENNDFWWYKKAISVQPSAVNGIGIQSNR